MDCNTAALSGSKTVWHQRGKAANHRSQARLDAVAQPPSAVAFASPLENATGSYEVCDASKAERC
ncbi:MAG TPA: hypothetical protein VJV96_07110 [Candidatus Angelobacter sp.]|nr:hypothetical protein [Candidatus Angelobacter sp.]